jgi:mannose-6-phosphate isomerase-like protein (cupin superfamily)
MRLTDGKIRHMREELAKQGILKDTDEIREAYVMSGFLTNITYMPTGETQNAHKHFLTKETIHVLAGEAEVFSSGNWYSVKQRQLAEFDLDEIHNVRALERKMPVVYIDASERIAAVTIAYKWLPPGLKVTAEEASLVLNYDWFSDKYENDPDNPSTSPVLRADEKIRRQFWEVVERNRQK